MKTDMKEYMQKRRLDRRNKLIKMGGGKCSVCGSKDNLEFDHTNRTKKSFSLTGCYLDKSWNKVLEEFEKCTLLCTECHKKKDKTL